MKTAKALAASPGGFDKTWVLFSSVCRRNEPFLFSPRSGSSLVRVEPKVKSKVKSEVEPKVEPNVEPNVEPEVEPKIEPKVEPSTYYIFSFLLFNLSDLFIAPLYLRMKISQISRSMFYWHCCVL